MLSWFANCSEKLAAFIEGYKLVSIYRRRSLAKPNEPIDGLVAKRKMDAGFVNNPKVGEDLRWH